MIIFAVVRSTRTKKEYKSFHVSEESAERRKDLHRLSVPILRPGEAQYVVVPINVED